MEFQKACMVFTRISKIFKGISQKKHGISMKLKGKNVNGISWYFMEFLWNFTETERVWRNFMKFQSSFKEFQRICKTSQKAWKLCTATPQESYSGLQAQTYYECTMSALWDWKGIHTKVNSKYTRCTLIVHSKCIHSTLVLHRRYRETNSSV